MTEFLGTAGRLSGRGEGRRRDMLLRGRGSRLGTISSVGCQQFAHDPQSVDDPRFHNKVVVLSGHFTHVNNMGARRPPRASR